MNSRRLKFWCGATGVGSIAAALVAVGLHFVSPVQVSETRDESLTVTKNVARKNNKTTPTASAETFEDVMDLDLRQPLVDTPIALANPRAATQPASLGIQLTGTFVEPGHSFAVFELPSGIVEVKSIGQRTSAGNAEVVRIDPGSVLLRIDGQPQTLKITKPAGQPRL